MAPDEPDHGPLQLLVVRFETTERFDGQIARELRDLRGRGLIRVVDARLLSRDADGELSETDLNAIVGDGAVSDWRPVAHLFGLNGAGDLQGRARALPPPPPARTAGFEIADLRRLTDEIAPGEHAAVLLVEHRWAGRVRELVLERGGRLVAQGMLTHEVTALIGAELQAKADAEAAIEIADAARGAALLRALTELTGGDAVQPASPPAAAAVVVEALVDAGFVRGCEAAEAVEALAQRGIVEQALLLGAAAEAEDLLDEGGAPPPPAG